MGTDAAIHILALHSSFGDQHFWFLWLQILSKCCCVSSPHPSAGLMHALSALHFCRSWAKQQSARKSSSFFLPEWDKANSSRFSKPVPQRETVVGCFTSATLRQSLCALSFTLKSLLWWSCATSKCHCPSCVLVGSAPVLMFCP